jgi:hypothetical protein
MRKVAILRALCLAVGVQLKVKDYFAGSLLTEAAASTASQSYSKSSRNKKKSAKQVVSSTAELACFSATISPETACFQPSDVVAIVPVTKAAGFRSRLADQTYASGKVALEQESQEKETKNDDGKEKHDSSPVGMELLRESLQLHEIVYGPSHRDTAHVLSALALAFLEQAYNAGTEKEDELLNLAILYQRQAVSILERTVHLDSQETITQYMNLAYFFHRAKRPVEALQCMRHVLRCWEAAYGSATGHPELAVLDGTVGSMLETAGDFERAQWFLRRALETSEKYYGCQSMKVAQWYYNYF